MTEHTKDTDCTVGSNDCCLECGVHHGTPCPVCHGSAFHYKGCEYYEEDETMIEDTETLIAKLHEAGVTEEAMDDVVQAAAASEVSSVNNGGMVEQINYLIEHDWSHEDIFNFVK